MLLWHGRRRQRHPQISRKPRRRLEQNKSKIRSLTRPRAPFSLILRPTDHHYCRQLRCSETVLQCSRAPILSPCARPSSHASTSLMGPYPRRIEFSGREQRPRSSSHTRPAPSMRDRAIKLGITQAVSRRRELRTGSCR